MIYIFKHLRHVADFNVLKTVYYSLCQSLIAYCISSWGGACKSNMIQLERAQRAILKVSSFKPFRFPTKELYDHFGVLTVRQLFILQTILRQHSMTGDSECSFTTFRGQPTRRFRLPLNEIRRTCFSQRFFCFLGRFLYGLSNRVLNFVNKNKYYCKKVVTDWLLTLSYDETENLLHPVE